MCVVGPITFTSFTVNLPRVLLPTASFLFLFFVFDTAAARFKIMSLQAKGKSVDHPGDPGLTYLFIYSTKLYKSHHLKMFIQKRSKFLLSIITMMFLFPHFSPKLI